MNKLEQLIEEYCLDGVEYKSIGSVVNYVQPSKYIVNSTDYNDDFSTPVLTAGQSFILGYTNEIDNLYDASKENPVIIFDDFTGAFKWVDFPFKVKSSAMKMLTENGDETVLRYIYHIMGNIGYSSNEHKRLWISKYSVIKIPLPPLPVQGEIVRILDNFTELTAELTAELSARKKQYEYYRNKLLTFGDEVEWKTLGSVCVMKAGKTIAATNISEIKSVDSPYPCYGGNGLRGYVKTFNQVGEAPLIGRQGALCGNVCFATGEYYATEHAVVVAHGINYNARFLYHLLIAMDLNQYKTAGAQPGLSVAKLEKIMVPVPPLEVQARIVAILDRFDTLCNDLTSGLPAEIEARRQQYEYYRDQLLSFPARVNSETEVSA
ncbi:restriction endonuclease subunit S [Acetobacterium sp. UBA5834]|jgi:type I restriction enzyme S subunit|uniref:restriction endonuclease subunit S n=1 Tax=Acetobacterium sp. UBA5834 TaxID=1945907 RepID=UPI00257AF02D|nr:restriction endonuclease subunit S [Acetobacterium sp. UBA5834]